MKYICIRDCADGLKKGREYSFIINNNGDYETTFYVGDDVRKYYSFTFPVMFFNFYFIPKFTFGR